MWAKSGGVPERSKGADCKSAGDAFGGSNPPPSTIAKKRGNSSVARASAFQAEGRGFESRFPLQVAAAAHVAQSVEHFLGKEEVPGSSPGVGSIHNYILSHTVLFVEGQSYGKEEV
jgi:hypothetical protein